MAAQDHLGAGALVETGPAARRAKSGDARPRVAVVVPVYNNAWSIGRTIDSILHQTLSAFELVVVDDGSTDGLDAALAPYVGVDPRVRVIRQANRGLAEARNRGVVEARAPLVALIDADDVWHPEFLSATVAALEAAPEAPFAYAYSFRLDVDDRVTAGRRLPSPPRHDLTGLLVLNSVGNGSAATFRRSRLLAVGGFDTSMAQRGCTGAEDWKLILELARQGEPVLVPRLLVGYRRVDTGMSRSQPDRQLRSMRAVLQEMSATQTGAPAQAFADSRTVMAAYLLPAFLRQGRLLAALRLAARAYLLNPLAFANPLVRLIHREYAMGVLSNLWRRITLQRPVFPRLADARFDGEQPFQYMRERSEERRRSTRLASRRDRAPTGSSRLPVG